MNNRSRLLRALLGPVGLAAAVVALFFAVNGTYRWALTDPGYVGDKSGAGTPISTIALSPDEQQILDRKNALVAEFMGVLAGHVAQEQYDRDYHDFLGTVVPDPERRATLEAPSGPRDAYYNNIPTPPPTGLPAIPHLEPAPTSPPATPTAAAIDYRSAWGAGLPVSRVSANIDSEHVFLPDAVTQDAGSVLGVISNRQAGKEADRLALVSMKTHSAHVLRTLPSSDMTITGAAVSDYWIVWLESVRDNGDEYKWALYTVPLQGGEPKRLGGSVPAEEQACAGCGSQRILLRIEQASVLWETVTSSSRPPSSHTVLFRTDLASGSTEQIGEGQPIPLSLSANERIEVRQVDSTRQVVWDKQLNRLVLLGSNTAGISAVPVVNGNGLMWEDWQSPKPLPTDESTGDTPLPEGGTINVIDTRLLPK